MTPRKPSAGKRERKRELDPYTLRWVVKLERARMKRNAVFWPHDDWNHAESMLERILKRADAIESRGKGKVKR